MLKLWCRIFGHKERSVSVVRCDQMGYLVTVSWYHECSRCGLILEDGE